MVWYTHLGWARVRVTLPPKKTFYLRVRFLGGNRRLDSQRKVKTEEHVSYSPQLSPIAWGPLVWGRWYGRWSVWPLIFGIYQGLLTICLLITYHIYVTAREESEEKRRQEDKAKEYASNSTQSFPIAWGPLRVTPDSYMTLASTKDYLPYLRDSLRQDKRVCKLLSRD